MGGRENCASTAGAIYADIHRVVAKLIEMIFKSIRGPGGLDELAAASRCH